jgi:flavin reductase (DIM6/NTAB) family NADH-FMN oxidoreductase RutF
MITFYKKFGEMPMSVTEQEFKNALKLWASGVAVVTNNTEAYGVKGMTVTSFSSVSLNPPQILVCLNQATDTCTAVLESGHFTVNILTTEQQGVSNQFAGGTSQEQRFAEVAWHEGENGSPVLDDALVSIECNLAHKVLAGSHWVIIGEVQKVDCRSGEPLMYFNGGYRGLQTEN